LRDDVVPEAEARWYPVIPLSDVAVMLGLAHTLVSEGLHDEVFLERCCTGAKQFIAYLTGEADGVAKTPEWAEQRSGIPARDLRELAREMARRRTLVTVSYSLQRAQHGEQPIWAALSLAALLGQIGLPGGGFGHGYGSMGDLGSPTANLPLTGGVPEGRNAVRDFIPCARIADLLLRPGEKFDYNGASLTYPDIRLVHWAGGNPFHHHQDLNRLRRALGRPDTVIVHEPYWTPMARHADLVFPPTTSLERNDIGSGGGRPDHLRSEPMGGEARVTSRFAAWRAVRAGCARRTPSDGRAWLEHLYERAHSLADVGGRGVVRQFWAQGSISPDSGRARAVRGVRATRAPSR
jgi:biotin/methionine sulfoxide reductase